MWVYGMHYLTSSNSFMLHVLVNFLVTLEIEIEAQDRRMVTNLLVWHVFTNVIFFYIITLYNLGLEFELH